MYPYYWLCKKCGHGYPRDPRTTVEQVGACVNWNCKHSPLSPMRVLDDGASEEDEHDSIREREAGGVRGRGGG